MISMAKARNALRDGKIIIYPTDTVWGMGCDPFNQKAIDKLFTIKGKKMEGLSVMFNNLIENAYVHSDLVVEKLEIDVTVTMEDGWIYLSVDDNGVGVEKHERRMVLERFQRGSNNHSQGSGLGLSLVTQQVEINSGTVEIMESPNGGARVRVAFPVIEGTDSN